MIKLSLQNKLQNTFREKFSVFGYSYPNTDINQSELANKLRYFVILHNYPELSSTTDLELTNIVFLECGGMLTAPKGIIESPNYRGQYPNNADCSWLIHLPNKRIGISFSSFNTQRSYDRLAIYDGPYSNMKRLFDWSGALVPYGYLKTRNYMYLRFTSSRSNDKGYYGFSGKYEEYLFYDKK